MKVLSSVFLRCVDSGDESESRNAIVTANASDVNRDGIWGSEILNETETFYILEVALGLSAKLIKQNRSFYRKKKGMKYREGGANGRLCLLETMTDSGRRF